MPTMIHPDDAPRLIERALGGDRRAWRRLHALLDPPIRRRLTFAHRARRCLEPRYGLDDLVAETWARLLARGGYRLRAFEPTRGTLHAYVTRIAGQTLSNLVAMRLTASRAAEVLASTDDLPPPTAASTAARIEARFALGRVWAHLSGTLPERGRHVLRLLYRDGRSVAEAAEALGVSTQVIHNWNHRIRARARALPA